MIKENSLFLAPMAGITDSIFRTLCKEKGADFVVSEMVSVDGIVRNSKESLELLSFSDLERPIGIQLFGSDPELFRISAEVIAEKFKPDFIDINSGCPVKKVVKRNAGAALLKDIKRFEKIVRAVVEAVKIPVTVKLRSGWFTNQWVDCEFAKCAEDCGVSAITLHPRSQTMLFSGHSFWERIAEVKKVVKIPVIGNGDIVDGKSALEMKKQTGCDALMIGRAALGNPWIFAKVKAALNEKEEAVVTITERYTIIKRHLSLYIERYGEARASREMKKHLGWYLKGIPNAKEWRDKIFRASSTKDFEKYIEAAFGELKYSIL
ncbi:MAG: tRNA dihydrouridine synthase DusB [Chitinispirillaceae bacterium]|nr:tRNA dihydrouridine synthase DusB [Chitinispirillaceae bacterium]